MKRSFIAFRAFLTLILTLAIASGAVTANEIKAPRDLRAEVYQITEPAALLMWRTGGERDDWPDKCNIYMADSKTEDMSKFKLVSDSSMRKGDMAYAVLYVEKNKEYSFYVTNVVNGVESERSNIAYFKYVEPFSIRFTTNPPETAKINEEYKYEMKAEASDGSPVKYKLEFAPKGAELSEDGVLTWTAKERGNCQFAVSAYTEENNPVRDYQSWFVYVTSCPSPGSLSGTVVNDDDTPVMKGEAQLYPTNMDSLYWIPEEMGLMRTRIENGKFEFQNLDSGSYYLLVMGDMFRQKWYPNSDTPEGAELIRINCGDAKSISMKLTASDNEKYYIRVESEPPAAAKKGTEYSYQVKAETNGDSTKIKYEVVKSPEGAKISENGLFTFTPDASGTYYFNVRVWLDGKKDVEAYHSWAVKVFNCETPATVKATFKYDDGTEVPFGYIKTGEPIVKDSLRTDDYQFFQYENGYAEFNLDEGSHYLMFMATDAEEVWYKDAANFESATKFEAKCGETYEITVTFKKVTPPGFKFISGTVYNASDNKPLPHALISIISTDAETGMQISFLTTGNGDGKYKMQVPDDHKYIVRASTWLDSTSQTPETDYLPQYYKLASDPTSAQVLEMTQDYENIDFYLTARPNYENSISGVVKSVDNEVVNDAYVIAFLVETTAENENMLYVSRVADADGNGAFKLGNLLPGKYVLLAMDKKREKFDYRPGFYLEGNTAVVDWESATRLTVTETSKTEDIAIVLDKLEHKKGKCNIIGGVGRHGKKGKVSDHVEAADAIAGALVYAYDKDDNIVGAGLTDQNGNFSIPGLDKGNYKLVISKVGYETSSANVDLTDDKNEASTSIELGEKVTSVTENITAAATAIAMPNPATTFVNFTFSTVQGKASIKTLNSLGEQVANAEFTTATGLNSYRLDVSTLPAGAYYATITIGRETFAIPFIVQH